MAARSAGAGALQRRGRRARRQARSNRLGNAAEGVSFERQPEPAHA